MKKIVLAAVAMGALAIGGGAFAYAQNQDSGAVTIEVTGGPEGSRSFSKNINEWAQVATTEGTKYTVKFIKDGKVVDEKTLPGGGTLDCAADDTQGKVLYGCVVGG